MYDLRTGSPLFDNHDNDDDDDDNDDDDDKTRLINYDKLTTSE